MVTLLLQFLEILVREVELSLELLDFALILSKPVRAGPLLGRQACLVLHLLEDGLHLVAHDLDRGPELLVLDLQLRHLLVRQLPTSLDHLPQGTADLVVLLSGERRVLWPKESLP